MKRIILTAFVIAISICACVPKGPLRYPAARWVRDMDRVPIDQSKVDESAIEMEAVDSQMYRQLEGVETTSGSVEGNVTSVASGGRQEALNVNNFDEVADSTWFTNRLGRSDLSSADIAEAGEAGGAPDASGNLRVVVAKTEGVAPRLIILDGRGRRYMLWFEPPALKGLAVGAEMLGAMAMNAAGYQVPPFYLAEFDTKMLVLGEGARTMGKYGKMRALTGDDLSRIVDRITGGKGGRIRAVAGAFPEGKYMGPFSYDGRRYGDKNDRIPHQHRRDLRGYKTFCAWLNLTMPSAAATADFFTKVDGGKGYLTHYLFDFTSAFGGAGTWAVMPDPAQFEREGYGEAVANLFTAGLRSQKENVREKGEYGFLNAGDFDPSKWKPSAPNLAASLMTKRDAFWAARIIMRFTDGDIDAMVEKAGFEDEGIRKYVARSLKARRDKIGAWAFSVVNPLDDFEIADAEDAVSLSFADLAVDHGLARAEDTQYRYVVLTRFERAKLAPSAQTVDTRATIDRDVIAAMDPRRVYMVGIRTKRAGDEWWLPSVDVYVQREGDGLKILGLSRRYGQR